VSVAAAIRQMLAAGLTIEQALVAAEAMEEHAGPQRTARQDRNARYYEKHKDEIKSKASEKRLKASETTETTEIKTPSDGGSGPPCPPTPPLITPTSDPLVGDRPAEAGVKPLTSLDRLWIEGVPILASMGMADSKARPLVGRWLKQTRDSPLTVLDAIQRARDHAVVDPIAWITRSLAEKPNDARKDSRDISGGFDKLDARLARRADPKPYGSEPEFDLAPDRGLSLIAGGYG
jgi:hypothetical protein